MVTKNVIYTLRKGVTTQKLKGKNINQSFENLSSFLNNCTNTTPDKTFSSGLTAYSAYNNDDDPAIAKKIVLNIEKLFGKGTTEPISYAYPSWKASSQTKTEWNIDAENLKKALDYLINGQPWPKYTFGPVELLLSYDFKFIDPSTKEILPNQQNDSTITVWLSRSRTCSPTFYFPFQEANNYFDEYVDKIEAYLPFKFERKHLRIVTENKDKGTFIFRKL